MRALLCFFVLTIAGSSQAATTVFQCEKNGIAIFSQFPCDENAKKVNIKTPNIAQTQNEQAQKNTLDSVDSYLTIQKVDREIAEHQQAIKKLKETVAKKKQKINYMTQDTANRMGASSIAAAIAQRTDELKSYFEPQINSHEKQIKALSALKDDLRQQSGL
ncbi:RNA-binding protein [Pseudoalteromonas sp. ZZD1]|uniref:RNA-binding protein n=1 Tax=Pseudoalteromonas sp. ZZD1 TaxID=3139395 RepID=UPI003BA954EE